MDIVKIKREDLEQFQRRANKLAIRENIALGLAYREIEDGYLVEISGENIVKRIRKPEFGTIRVKKGKYQLKN